jgi:hypothetical protein
MVLFLVNAHQVDPRALVSHQSRGGRKVIVTPLCLHQDRSWVRQRIVTVLLFLRTAQYLGYRPTGVKTKTWTTILKRLLDGYILWPKQVTYWPNLVNRRSRKRRLGGCRRRWDDNIKMGRRDMGWGVWTEFI